MRTEQKGMAGKGKQRAIGQIGTFGQRKRERVTEGEQRIERCNRHRIRKLLKPITHANPSPKNITGKIHFASYILDMIFSWTPHRFVGGALALDVANSVILRMDAARSIDRFAVPEQLQAFAQAACELSAERELFGCLQPVQEECRAAFFAFREAVDAHFRAVAQGQQDPALLANMMETGPDFCGRTRRRLT